ncbi:MULTISPECIES: bifunctional indole-3-glycerol-phosphate synthase TrpC/phosphoribosylanthranilate isomerase TrpF [unclassified Tatumella]|uniref:bifunctional indole-3-glycerol-phosphate synthase TrpC/phosphoribosylanthranilate isomerase TrpF n=1 Tax=unclassified Tatumella TaxID=2649542 RepID=UPI001BAFB4D2|nr:MULTISPECIES: bifunctional indole-3-glycerol-phosphate synthase TrpC/phosphoribosylanthranilate isomerase TrpF [unclassified Tatumella]MBS0856532.1 bifunctional indole-3-glycerol-phosphate synthase TrpC/phosphoribosylanthranilate isomerase TrpF [Tatumella sp. JGM16]MBS0876270.1 bifunctional indole-3-glycerol-phosphate synthase TrpC/phosphoribosylanthranilate isomerase TrpF [Tatumella sp. JGM82]MBS0889319.1 bifunctional indole-3-glycerol-phosphate synthase TrpC/phosphoribosylanthranilate isome
MKGTVLEKIVADKALWLAARKARQPLSDFQQALVPSARNFYQALQRDKSAFILECKKASPSKGLIREDFDPAAIAAVYRDYASAVSVLTDEKYFQGNFEFLPEVSAAITQPVLCKDFIIDPYQIYLARYYQADAILLMLSVLDDQQYQALADVAHSLNMGVLTEISNQQELDRALKLKPRVAGINNRDLRDLSIDLDKTRQLAPQLPQDTIVISESGIYDYQQIAELRRYANGFLIGSSLMSEDNLAVAVRRVLIGDNKVCGLTRSEDAAAAWQAGAVYGGIIFAQGSPRQVSLRQAEEIVAAAPLKFVGVFRDQPAEEVAGIASHLRLSAVQLHGSESAEFIAALRQQLPSQIAIWKAFSISDHLPERNLPDTDRYLFDNGNGGSGQRFDWSLLQGQDLHNVMLAGGLNAENCAEAALTGCAGLDFNSGVETAPGIKDPKKLADVFRQLRAY